MLLFIIQIKNRTNSGILNFFKQLVKYDLTTEIHVSLSSFAHSKLDLKEVTIIPKYKVPLFHYIYKNIINVQCLIILNCLCTESIISYLCHIINARNFECCMILFVF